MKYTVQLKQKHYIHNWVNQTKAWKISSAKPPIKPPIRNHCIGDDAPSSHRNPTSPFLTDRDEGKSLSQTSVSLGDILEPLAGTQRTWFLELFEDPKRDFRLLWTLQKSRSHGRFFGKKYPWKIWRGEYLLNSPTDRNAASPIETKTIPTWSSKYTIPRVTTTIPNQSKLGLKKPKIEPFLSTRDVGGLPDMTFQRIKSPKIPTILTSKKPWESPNSRSCRRGMGALPSICQS